MKRSRLVVLATAAAVGLWFGWPAPDRAFTDAELRDLFPLEDLSALESVELAADDHPVAADAPLELSTGEWARFRLTVRSAEPVDFACHGGSDCPLPAWVYEPFYGRRLFVAFHRPTGDGDTTTMVSEEGQIRAAFILRPDAVDGEPIDLAVPKPVRGREIEFAGWVPTPSRPGRYTVSLVTFPPEPDRATGDWGAQYVAHHEAKVSGEEAREFPPPPPEGVNVYPPMGGWGGRPTP